MGEHPARLDYRQRRRDHTPASGLWTAAPDTLRGLRRWREPWLLRRRLQRPIPRRQRQCVRRPGACLCSALPCLADCVYLGGKATGKVATASQRLSRGQSCLPRCVGSSSTAWRISATGTPRLVVSQASQPPTRRRPLSRQSIRSTSGHGSLAKCQRRRARRWFMTTITSAQAPTRRRSSVPSRGERCAMVSGAPSLNQPRERRPTPDARAAGQASGSSSSARDRPARSRRLPGWASSRPTHPLPCPSSL